jgi:hypothetical protein
MKPLLTARDLISFVAFVITAAEFTYWLGGRTRQAIDSASNTLAALWAISWGVGEQSHYEVLSEAIDTVIAAFAPKPAEMLPGDLVTVALCGAHAPLNGTYTIASVTSRTPQASPGASPSVVRKDPGLSLRRPRRYRWFCDKLRLTLPRRHLPRHNDHTGGWHAPRKHEERAPGNGSHGLVKPFEINRPDVSHHRRLGR